LRSISQAATFFSVSSQERLLVGISGIPGAGKSTLAQQLIEHINELLTDTNDQAIIVGLDGWHLTRAQLDVFPDPQLAHDRRGAHWTFDGHGYSQFVASLKNRETEAVLSAPTFDHALKDPTPQGVTIHSFHRIVVVEGIYAFLSIDPWLAASKLLDERWWLEIDENEARRRLARRHVVSGITKDEEAGLYRADHNDLPSMWASFLSFSSDEPASQTDVLYEKTCSSLPSSLPARRTEACLPDGIWGVMSEQ
jgi:pantothenate kinase